MNAPSTLIARLTDDMEAAMLRYERRWARRRRLITCAVAAAVGVTGTAVAAIAASRDGTPTVTTSATPPVAKAPQTAAPTGAIDPRLSAAYAVLGHARNASDTVPNEQAVQAVAPTANAQAGRRIANSESEIYLVPTRDGACVTSANGSASCAATEELLDGDISMSGCAKGLAKGSVRVEALIPDGVGGVDLLDATGRTTSYKVTANGFTADIPVSAEALPIKAEWTTATGQHHSEPLPIPPSITSTVCAQQ